MQHKSITFIGTGNMATALIRGLVKAHYPGNCITAHDVNTEKSQALAIELNIRHEADLALAVKDAAIIVFAIKPNAVAAVCQDLKDHLQHKPCIISVAAGIQLATIARFLQTDALAMIRSMPNTPALIGCGATGLYANANAKHADREWAESLFRAVGIVHWCDKESTLDAITALSGSGPAYIFLVMQAMQEAAESLGLEESLAKTFSIQTVLGASRVALETAHSLAELRKQVTSPGGTTEKALEVLEQGNLKALFARAMQSAHQQAKVLSSHYDTL
ncbi:MAG: proC [Gammaproteobacteria bacterium]|jgi:pyrroline-5-carboxylate reductase|nr:proC [Gammaproteobacteria bacterium]